jgi:D-alanyl-D-alanine carboxypeptidase (penicillin-binding protein 5/6)
MNRTTQNRKTITLLLSLTLLLSAALPCFASAAHLGDANADGMITTADARRVLRAALQLESPADRAVMDVDGDAEITTTDARLVLRYGIGLETCFPIEREKFPETVKADPKAACALLYDARANRILFNKNGAKQTAPASLTKLLTALTALNNCPETAVFRVGNEIDLIGYNSSVCYLQKGWNASLKTLITGMLSSSGNDAAYCIAVNVARSVYPGISDQTAVRRFVALMNQTAAQLGMRGSRFQNPDGYDAEGQYATAQDLLLLAKAALGNPTIRAICGKHRIEAYLADGNGVTWYNTNRMLDPKDAFYHPEVTGLKTGSTTAAGNCIIVSFTHDGREMIAVILGAPSDKDRYEAVEALMAALP